MKLNKATSHALRVLVACARSGDGLTKVADLAAELDLSPQNTFKIVHLLSRAGFVEGERGRYGGVRLKQPAEAIKVGDVVQAMELMPDATDSDSAALAVHQAQLFDAAFDAFVKVLNQTTIADMAKGQVKAARQAAPKAAKPRKTSLASRPRGASRTSPPK
ncbi:MAG: Rrf2 family transcriptional regulator [Hyphomicrobiaceae bacterium]